MIKTKVVAPGVLKIIAPEKLNAEDFSDLAPQVESITREWGQIRLLIDASGLDGWDNVAALERHAAFVKAHQQKVERIAILARHEWQHWLVGAVKVFLHPEVRAFDKGDEAEALRWLENRGSAAPARSARQAAIAGWSEPWEVGQHQVREAHSRYYRGRGYAAHLGQ